MPLLSTSSLDKRVYEETPTSPFSSNNKIKVFGTDLDEICRLQNSTKPIIVQDTTVYLLKKGMNNTFYQFDKFKSGTKEKALFEEAASLLHINRMPIPTL